MQHSYEPIGVKKSRGLTHPRISPQPVHSSGDPMPESDDMECSTSFPQVETPLSTVSRMTGHGANLSELYIPLGSSDSANSWDSTATDFLDCKSTSVSLSAMTIKSESIPTHNHH